MAESFDFAVIGAGVFGAWIAHAARKRGQSVILLDSRGPANALASSGGESRILRVGYGGKATYSEWALKSLAQWRELLHPHDLFFQTGVLWMGPRNDAYHLATQQTLRTLGVPFEVLSPEDCRRRYPQLRMDPDSMAIFEPESGAVLARRAVTAVVDAAIRAGVVYRTAAVAPPAIDGALEQIVTQTGERISAGRFVFACGPWLPKLFPDVVGNRIIPTRQEVFFFAPPAGNNEFGPSAMPTWIDFNGKSLFYGIPNLEARGFKIAADLHGPEIDPDTDDRLATAEGLASIRQFLAARFPQLRGAPCIETRVCQYENTASGDFLIDRHPAAPNVWIAGGGSGHGFKHGPAVAEYVLSLTDGGAAEAAFSLEAAARPTERAVH